MSWRFHKRLKIIPGIWLNLSKTGISLSLGGRGLTWNSRRGTTLSAEGTGVSYNLPNPGPKLSHLSASERGCGCFILLLIIVGLVWLVSGTPAPDATSSSRPFSTETPTPTPADPFDRPHYRRHH